MELSEYNNIFVLKVKSVYLKVIENNRRIL